MSSAQANLENSLPIAFLLSQDQAIQDQIQNSFFRHTFINQIFFKVFIIRFQFLSQFSY